MNETFYPEVPNKSVTFLILVWDFLLLTWPYQDLHFIFGKVPYTAFYVINIKNIPPIARNEFICIELVLMWNTDLSHVMQPKRNQMDIFLRLSGHVLFVCTSHWGHYIFEVDCYFTRLNLRKKDRFQFYFPVFLASYCTQNKNIFLIPA